MFIQTTTNFNDSLDAMDSLKGLKEVPGFCFGYITEQDSEKFEVITMFNCQQGTPGQGQKHVIEIRSNPEGMLAAKIKPTPDNLIAS